MRVKPSPWSRPAGRRLRLAALASLLAFALLLLAAVLPAWGEAVNGRNNSATFTGTSLTCQLPAPLIHDVAVVGVTSTQTVSTVSDSSGNTYAVQVSAGAATSGATEGGLAYLYTAPMNAVPANGLLTITVSFSASTQGGVVCLDLAGFGSTPAHVSSGTGATGGNGTASQAASVVSYTPTAGNFEVSVYAGAMCNGLGSAAFPVAEGPPATGRQLVNNAQAGADLACSFYGTSPPTTAHTFQPVGYAAWTLQWPGAATADAYTATYASPIEGCHSAGCGGTVSPASTWAEASMDLPANTVLKEAVAESFALASSDAGAQARPAETVSGVTASDAAAQARPAEAVHGVSATNSPAFAGGSAEPFSMCAIVKYLGVNVTNSCSAVSYAVSLVVAPTANPAVGQTVTLTATANPYVFGPLFIKIFDTTNSSTSAGVTCAGTSCTWTLASHHNGVQQFEAAVTSSSLAAAVATSNVVNVLWGTVPQGNLCAYYALVGGGTFDPPVLTYSQNLATKTLALTFVKTCVVADTGVPWTVAPQPDLAGLSANAQERAHSQNTTWTGTASGTFHWVFWHQFGPAVSFRFSQAEGSASVPTLFYTQFGSPLTAPMSKTPAPYWLDAGTAWRATNPFTTSPDLLVWFAAPGGGLQTSTADIAVVYGPRTLCTGPWQAQLTNGCFWAGMGPYVTIFGLQGFMGMVMLGVDGAVWIQTKNGWVVVIVMAAGAVAFGGALPSYFFLFGLVLTGFTVAGVVYRLFWRRT